MEKARRIRRCETCRRSCELVCRGGRSVVPVSPARCAPASAREPNSRGRVPPHVARLPSPPPRPRRGPRRRGGPPGRPRRRDPRPTGSKGPDAGVGVWPPSAVKSVTPGPIQVRLVGERMGPPPPRAMLRLSACLLFFLLPALELDCWMDSPSWWLLVGPRPCQVNGQRHGADPLLLPSVPASGRCTGGV
jgi:hypothetical protein